MHKIDLEHYIIVTLHIAAARLAADMARARQSHRARFLWSLGLATCSGLLLVSALRRAAARRAERDADHAEAVRHAELIMRHEARSEAESTARALRKIHSAFREPLPPQNARALHSGASAGGSRDLDGSLDSDGIGINSSSGRVPRRLPMPSPHSASLDLDRKDAPR